VITTSSILNLAAAVSGDTTLRLRLKDEVSVLKVCMGKKKAMMRHSVPESVARRIHTRLLNGEETS